MPPRKKAVPKPEIDPETCATCRFFLLDDPKDEGGICRRYPSVHVGDEESGGWTQSPMLPDDWCGEYKRLTQ